MAYSFKAGVACNLMGTCLYCYEKPIADRSAGFAWDLDGFIRELETVVAAQPPERRSVTLHGGEPLWVLKPPLLERVLQTAARHGIRVAVQTNGTILADRHIELFRHYGVCVGISLDGHLPEMNAIRAGFDPRRAVWLTDLVLRNARRLIDAGVFSGFITVLHRANVDSIPDWLRYAWHELGVRHIRLNPCIIDDPSLRPYELDTDELGDLFIEVARMSLDYPGHDWRPISEIARLFARDGNCTCIFGRCDPYRTDAERVLSGTGERRNCLKTAKDGIAYLAADRYDDVRYRLLPMIPRDYGGCQGCAYWDICQGLCPAEGWDGDWRTRSRFCEAYMRLYDAFAAILKPFLRKAASPSPPGPPNDGRDGGWTYEDSTAGYYGPLAGHPDPERRRPPGGPPPGFQGTWYSDSTTPYEGDVERHPSRRKT